MKTSIEFNEIRRTVISAQPGEYDGQPIINELIVDALPSKINRFRTAVSCCLPFLPYTNGEIETPTSLFPLTANMIRDLAPLDAHPTNIEWKPSDIPAGSGTLIIRAETNQLNLSSSATIEDPKVAEISLLRSDVYAGSVSTTNSCEMASNAWLLRELESSDRYLLSVIAIGVLFAEDYDARVLQIKSSERLQRIRLSSLAQTIESVGLKLEMI